MDIELKRKYTWFGDRAPTKTMYSPRTGNSHGPTKDKILALVPCRRAAAGAKTFTPPPLRNMRQMVLLVDGLTGKRRFVEEGRFTAQSSQAEVRLVEVGLT